jgi:hypothetical protein
VPLPAIVRCAAALVNAPAIGGGWSHTAAEVNAIVSSTAEAAKRVLRRLFGEVITGHNFAAIDELFASMLRQLTGKWFEFRP